MNKTGFVHLEFPKSTPLFSMIFIKFSLNLLLLTITSLSIPQSTLIYLKNLSQNIFTIYNPATLLLHPLKAEANSKIRATTCPH